MSQQSVEEALKALPRTEEALRRLTEWMNDLEPDSGASKECGNPSDNDVKGEIVQTN